MQKWYTRICGGLITFLVSSSLFAAGSPFTDVPYGSPYYSAVNTLYTNRVISDDGSHLFRPADTIDRDAFVGLSVSVSCKQCLTATLDDIVKYSTSPFIDLTKQNPFFYCIAYANEKNIVQGYALDAAGNTSCQDGRTFQSTPFCENNKTTRIEGATMLLRQANLWNDIMGSTATRTIEISDVSDYWYGYARKGIEAGILTLKSGNTVAPDEYITRGEFAIMAARMLSYNQCVTSGGDNTEASALKIVSRTNAPLSRSLFGSGEYFRIVPILEGGASIDSYTYVWRAVDGVTGRVVTGSDTSLLGSSLGSGNWYIELSIIDKSSGNIVSNPTMTVTVSDGSQVSGGGTSVGTGDGRNASGNGGLGGIGGNGSIGVGGSLLPSVSLSASALSIDVGGSIDFSSVVLGTGPMTYVWDFGDGTRISGGSSGGGTNGGGTAGGVSGTTGTSGGGTNGGANGNTGTNGGGGMGNAGVNGTNGGGTSGNTGTNGTNGANGTTGTTGNSGAGTTGGTNVGGTAGGVSGGSSSMQSHSYSNPGFYPVTVTITDAQGRTAQSTLVVGVVGQADSDGDGVGDAEDICPLVAGLKDNRGCPLFETNTYSRGVNTPIPQINTTPPQQPQDTQIGSLLSVVSSNGTPLSRSLFGSGEYFRIVPILEGGASIDSYTYVWRAVDGVTGRVVTGSDTSLLGSSLGSGNWYIELSIIDKSSGNIVSNPTMTVTVSDGSQVSGGGTSVGTGDGRNASGNGGLGGIGGNGSIGVGGSLLPSVSLSASALSIDVGGSIDFSSVVLGTGPMTYVWDFGDGTRISGGSSGGGTNGGGTAGGVSGTTGTSGGGTNGGANGNTGTNGGGGMGNAGVNGTNGGGTSGNTGTNGTNGANGTTGTTGNSGAGTTGGTNVGGTAGGVSGGSSSMQSHSYSNPGFYPVTVTITDAQGRTAQSTLVVGVRGSMPSVGSSIVAVGSDSVPIYRSTFQSTDTFDLIGMTSIVGNYRYEWTAVDSITGRMITGNGNTLPGSSLGIGNWYIRVAIIDINTGLIISTPSTTLTISDGNPLSGTLTPSGNGALPGNTSLGIGGNIIPSVSISADTLNTNAGGTINFASYGIGAGTLTYIWNFGDGSSPLTGVDTSAHTFRSPGVYLVTVSMTDTSGNTARASMLVEIRDNTMTIGSSISVIGSNGSPLSQSTFQSTDTFNLIGTTSIAGDYRYEWTAVDRLTGRVVTGQASSIPSSALGIGSWSISLSIIDRVTNILVSAPTTTLTISDGSTPRGNPQIAGNGWTSGSSAIGIGGNLIPSVSVSASSLSGLIGSNISFTSSAVGSGPLTYIWDFGDGTRTTSTTGGPQSHVFTTPGSHIISVTVRDVTGQTVQASVIVSISDTDTDGDGVTDSSDLCPAIAGSAANRGCPAIDSLLAGLENNACLIRQAQTRGTIIASPVCDTCPCTNTISFSALVRPCDILFPAILSTDGKTVFSRGGFYQIP